jgi:hypothetical protein
MLTNQAQENIALGRGGSYSLSRDALKHQIWDTRQFGTVAQDFTFFTQPIGSAWRFNSTKTVNETNIMANGTLPNGQTFLVNKMSVGLIAPLTAAVTNTPDLSQAFTDILQSSVFEIKIAGREFEFQLHGTMFLPRTMAMNGDTAGAGVHRIGDIVCSGIVRLDPTPIFLDQLVNFQVRQILNNPDTRVKTILDAACALLDGVYGTEIIILEGFLTRAK